MAMKWTDDQRQVIEHKDGNLLVAAAAGSGKTAVLVEHIIEKLTDAENPVSLSEMVVMTFTEAAASEMRERIKRAIDEKLREQPENAQLIRESGNIQNTAISTIDAYCKRLITENYAVINLDPSFRIAEEGELKLLKSDTIRELMDECYEKGEDDFLRFVDSFSHGKEDDGIGELILKVYSNAESSPWPEEYLRALRQMETPAEDSTSPWEQYLMTLLRGRTEDDIQELMYAISVSEEPDGPETYLANLLPECRSLEKLRDTETLTDFVGVLSSVQFDRLKSSRSAGRELAAAARNNAKDDIALMKKTLVLPDPQLRGKMEDAIRESMGVLISLTEDFAERYRAEKERRHMLDFADLEHKALEILYQGEGDDRHPSPIADDYAGSLKEILVDEYQDSNFVQEELIRALSAERFGRPDVFQVGDVKQSIYSFRLARPDLFLKKYQDPAYPRVELSKNFRSRPEVLDAVNDVFFAVMRKETGGIDYTEETSLHLGRETEDSGKAADRKSADHSASGSGISFPEDCRAELLLMEMDDLPEEAGDQTLPDKTDAEASLIAKRIQALHQEGYQYKDIVILMRSPGSWGDTAVEVLGQEGIPAYCVSNEGYFGTVEVETVLSLLSVIDNPRQSIALAAVMHSPIYRFTDEELAEIAASCGTLEETFPGEELLRTPAADPETVPGGELPGTPAADQDSASAGGCPETPADPETADREEGSRVAALPAELAEKLRRFREDLRHFRRMARVLSIHELLYRIYDETGYYHYAAAMPAGKRRKANLDALIDSALSFEKTSYKGLFDYIRYIEKLKKYDTDQGEASVFSDQDDLVRIMSIHKSKGLQFKVVFVSGTGRHFNVQDLSDKILIDPVLGIACDYTDTENKVLIPSVRKLAIREKLRNEQLGEELRVLYVAMTRAEDKLILTGTVKSFDRTAARYQSDRPLSGTAIRNASSMLDWILMAERKYLGSTGTDTLRGPFRIQVIRLSSIFTEGEAALTGTVLRSEALMEELQAFPSDDPEADVLRRRFTWQYPHAAAAKLFPKHSVSEIKEAEIERFEESIRKHTAEEGEMSDKLQRSGSRNVHTQPGIRIENAGPEDEETDILNRKSGAAVGDAYHHVLARYDYTGDLTQLPELIPAAELALIQPERLETFLRSPLAARFKKAQESGFLFREKHFMKEVPYNYLFKDSDILEPVLLQGIIDAFFLEGEEIVLVDYKSDHVDSAERLIGRYRVQLSLYADALEKISGKKVKEKLLYSIRLGQTIEC